MTDHMRHRPVDQTAELEKLKQEMFGDKATQASLETVGHTISETSRISLPLRAAPERLEKGAVPWADNRAMIVKLFEPILRLSRTCPGPEHTACCRAKSGQHCFPKWREREDPEWYALRIHSLLGQVNRRVSSQGELVAGLAADEAFELGCLFNEALIKFRWGQYAGAGQKSADGAKIGGDMRRSANPKRLSREETVAAVGALLAQGMQPMVAYSLVAEQQDVKEQTIRKEYAAAKKSMVDPA